jgi:hypothetical protein
MAARMLILYRLLSVSGFNRRSAHPGRKNRDLDAGKKRTRNIFVAFVARRIAATEADESCR